MDRDTRRGWVGILVGVLLTLTSLALNVAEVGAKSAPLYVGCGTSSYGTVQAAIDAAPSGATVYLCKAGSPYNGPVGINKSLTLTGDPGVVIQAPAGDFTTPAQYLPTAFTSDSLQAPSAIVAVSGTAVSVAITNLTISGPFQTAQGCAPQEFGILVIDGASTSLNGVTVSTVRDSNTAWLGCQHGVGIQVGREYWSGHIEDFVGHATISNTTVSGYQKNGVTVDGPGSTLEVRDSTITGDGRVDYIAQNGIQISRGATGQVKKNSISNNAYTGGYFASAAGVLIYGGWGDPVVTNVQIDHNTLVNNDMGIAAENFNDTGDGAATVATNIKMVNNTLTNNAVTNFCPFGYDGCYGYVTYQVGIEDIGNGDKINANSISGVGYINPTNDPSNGIYIEPIDTTSFPTTNVKVHGNHIS